MIGVVEICHAVVGCGLIVMTELPTEESSSLTEPAPRLYFETKEECRAAFDERVNDFAMIMLQQYGSAPIRSRLACISEAEAQRVFGIPPLRIEL